MHPITSSKRFCVSLIAGLACALPGVGSAEEIVFDTPAKGFSYSLGVQTGNNIVKQLPDAAGDIDLEAMMLGISDRLAGNKTRLDVAELAFWSGKFLAMLEERNKAKAGDNIQAGIDFRTQYEQKEGVAKTSGGVLYRQLEAGEGRQPGIGQVVSLHVIGRTLSGRLFDDSRSRGVAHQVKVRELREGLQEAVTLMNAGARWEVVVPPELAYGELGKGDIGPNETLLYEIELLNIQ